MKRWRSRVGWALVAVLSAGLGSCGDHLDLGFNELRAERDASGFVTVTGRVECSGIPSVDRCTRIGQVCIVAEWRPRGDDGGVPYHYARTCLTDGIRTASLWAPFTLRSSEGIPVTPPILIRLRTETPQADPSLPPLSQATGALESPTR